jgi:periplasmic divalent cation tolerance protein
MKNNYVSVFVTSKNIKEAGKISAGVLKNKLAACASIIKGVNSSYWWHGKIENSSETLIIMKTKIGLMEKLTSAIKKAHSYSVPEIIALPIVRGNPDYLKWINESVTEE